MKVARSLFKEIIERDKIRTHSFIVEESVTEAELCKYVKSIRLTYRNWLDRIPEEEPESIQPIQPEASCSHYEYDDYQQSQDDFLVMQEPTLVPDSPQKTLVLEDEDDIEEFIPATPTKETKRVWFRTSTSGYEYKKQDPPKELGIHFVTTTRLEDGKTTRKRKIMLRNGKVLMRK